MSKEKTELSGSTCGGGEGECVFGENESSECGSPEGQGRRRGQQSRTVEV